MGKTLKICLAMGGGVSLGSFSGAALTEALKLLILYGKDKKGNDYEKVVLDGMSGASAGAIALTIMLKTLLDYKAMMDVYNDKVKYYERLSDHELKARTGTDHRDKKIDEEGLVEELANSYFGGDVEKAKKHNKIEQLKALQLAQKVQRQIWTKQLTVKNLYGKKLTKYPIEAHDSFGLLDRNVLIESAKFYLVDNVEVDPKNVQVLDENRVLFACSLTNMVPIELEEDQSDDIPILKQNAYKSTGSQNHAELRVFDFIFKDDVDKASDNRWFQISEKPLKNEKRNPKMSLQFKDKASWAILSSSALACGAFPFAFEPVVLRRYREEYQGYWPFIFDKLARKISKVGKQQSFFKPEDLKAKLDPIDYNSFNFPYIDGGTFNNEPIREAFRIGSFQDFKKVNEDADRLILFVDPAVRQEKYNSFNVGSYQAVSSNTDSRTTSLNKETTKMFGNVGSTIGLLANQGSIKEEHRIKDALQSLKLREELFDYIHKNNEIHQRLTISLIYRAFDKIQINLNQGAISLGTRNVVEYFQNELMKVCHERYEKVEDCHLFSDKDLLEIAKKIEKGKLKDPDDPEQVNEGVAEMFNILNNGMDEVAEADDIENRKVLFAQTVFRVLTDFSLRTVGKDLKSEYMAILPISEGLQTIELPGDEVEAFAGFASYPSREYAFDYGRFSALLSLKLKEGGFREDPDKPNKPINPIIEDDSLEMIYESLKDHISALKFYKEDYKYKDDVKSLYDLSIKRLTGLQRRPDGKGGKRLGKSLKNIFNSVKTGVLGMAAISPFKRSLIPWMLNGVTAKLSEDINYKTLPGIAISIITDRRLKGKINIEFRDEKKKSTNLKVVRIYEHEPDGKPKYQYLFQLHYLEYIDWKSYNDAMENKLEKGRLEKGEQFAGESIAYGKIGAENVKEIGLALTDRLPNPSIDSNLNYRDWRDEYEKNSKYNEIKSLSFGGAPMGNLEDELNNKKSSLFHSLTNLNYHVNPMLEYDMRDKKLGWYFKDNTRAFYHTLLK